jgi:Flp pilus assembly protein TadD
MKSFPNRDLRRVVATLIAVALASLGCASSGLGQSDPAGEVQAEILKQMVQEQEARRELRGESFEEPPPQTVESYLSEGDHLRDAGDAASALWVYLQAHELDRSDPLPLLRIAGLHLGAEPERAVAIFSHLAEQDDGSAAPLTGLGLAHVAQGDSANAEKVLRRAVDLDPAFPAARNALGIVLEQRAAHDEARDHFVCAIALQPSSYEPLNNLGVSYLATRDNARALHALERAALLETRDPAVFNNMGLALGRLGRYEEALEAFRRAGPDHAAWNNLAWVRREQGHYSAAISAYERALLVARGEQRLPVLRNLLAARKALEGHKKQSSEEAGSPGALP